MRKQYEYQLVDATEWTVDEMAEKLNRYGQQGWRVVSHVQVQSDMGYFLLEREVEIGFVSWRGAAERVAQSM